MNRYTVARAAGLDVGGQVDLGGQRRHQRPGGDRGEVGLQQQVVDRVGQQRRRAAGPRRGRPRRAARGRARTSAPCPVRPEPGRLVAAAGRRGRRGRGRPGGGSGGPAGPAPPRGVRPGPRARPTSSASSVAAQRGRARPADLLGQGPAYGTAAVPGADERGDGRRWPATPAPARPSGPRRAPRPRCRPRWSAARTATPRRRCRAGPRRGPASQDERGDRLVDVEGHGDPAQLPHAEPAGAAGRERGPARPRPAPRPPGARPRWPSAAARRARPSPGAPGRPRRPAPRWRGRGGCARSRRARPTSRGTTTRPGSRTASRPRAQQPGDRPVVAAGRWCSPTGEPQVSRSSTSTARRGCPEQGLAEPGGVGRAGRTPRASARPGRRSRPARGPRPGRSTRAGLRRSSTCSSGGPEPGGVRAEHLAGHPHQPQRPRGAPHQGERPAAGPRAGGRRRPRRGPRAAVLTGSGSTARASTTCRAGASSRSRARCTLARVVARTASEPRSVGTGTARSPRGRQQRHEPVVVAGAQVVGEAARGVAPPL